MARVRSLAGYPVEQHNSPNRGGRMTGHRGIALHIAQGYYQGTINWQNNPDQRYSSGERVRTCSTWIVGRESGEWAQMVDTAEIAWCQMGGSYDWLSIELAGWAPAAPSPWQIEACAQLLVWAHRTHGIPLAIANHPGERGLGHHSMDREWLGEEWGHESCPGSGVIAAKAAIVARAKVIAGTAPAPSTEEDDMLHGQVPAGQQMIIVSTPWDESRISFGCDMGKAKLRVAEHLVGTDQWFISEIVVTDKDKTRKDLPKRANIDRRSIVRLPLDDSDKLDTPVGYLAWLV